jgi:hypothetical protein
MIAGAIVQLLQSGNVRPTSTDIANAIKLAMISNPIHV